MKHGTGPTEASNRSQIQNIVKAVVPKQELLDAQLDLALAHVHHYENQPDVRPAPVMPLALEPAS